MRQTFNSKTHMSLKMGSKQKSSGLYGPIIPMKLAIFPIKIAGVQVESVFQGDSATPGIHPTFVGTRCPEYPIYNQNFWCVQMISPIYNRLYPDDFPHLQSTRFIIIVVSENGVHPTK